MRPVSTTATVGACSELSPVYAQLKGIFLFYYIHHIGDYLAHTAHLSILEHGVYCRLLQVYYLTEKPIPIEDPHRSIGAKSPDEIEAVNQVLKEFFKQSPDGWKNKRCEEELQAVKVKSEKARKSAEARWNANALRTHCEGNAIQEPISNIQYPKNSLSISNPNVSNLDVVAVPTHSERNTDAMRTHKVGLNKDWAYKLKERELAGETLSNIAKKQWREALKET